MPVVFDTVIIFPRKIVLIAAKIPDTQTIVRSKEQFPFRFKQISDAAKQRSGIRGVFNNINGNDDIILAFSIRAATHPVLCLSTFQRSECKAAYLPAVLLQCFCDQTAVSLLCHNAGDNAILFNLIPFDNSFGQFPLPLFCCHVLSS